MTWEGTKSEGRIPEGRKKAEIRSPKSEVRKPSRTSSSAGWEVAAGQSEPEDLAEKPTVLGRGRSGGSGLALLGVAQPIAPLFVTRSRVQLGGRVTLLPVPAVPRTVNDIH